MIPTNYTINKFYQFAGYPKYNKSSNTYYGGCPICKEGKSWGRKRRCFYIVDEDYIYCQNCSRGWSPLNWLVQVSGESRDEILTDVENYEPNVREILNQYEKNKIEEKNKIPTLPDDSVNLSDPVQIDYYSSNSVIQEAIKFIKERRLDTAKYRAKSFWISLKDKSHKNRLCIPFYDLNGQIIFYQTRAIFDQDNPPKYKSKISSDKSLFNIEHIDPLHDKIYLLEGPIDSMFVKNAVGMCGLSATELQRNQLHNYPFHERVWVLDNDIHTPEVYNKYIKLIEDNEKVFIWPQIFVKYKDINEVCIKFKLDEFPYQIIDQNTFSGRSAILKLDSLRL